MISEGSFVRTNGVDCCITAQALPRRVIVPGGLTTAYGYDRAHRLTSLANAVGAATIISHTYTFDGAGNRTALAEFVAGITAPRDGEASARRAARDRTAERDARAAGR